MSESRFGPVWTWDPGLCQWVIQLSNGNVLTSKEPPKVGRIHVSKSSVSAPLPNLPTTVCWLENGDARVLPKHGVSTLCWTEGWDTYLREQHLIPVHAHPPADVLNALKMRGPPPQHAHTYPQWSSGHKLRTTPEDVNYVEQRQPTPKEHAPPEVQAYLGSIPAKALSLSGGSQGYSSSSSARRRTRPISIGSHGNSSSSPLLSSTLSGSGTSQTAEVMHSVSES